MLNTLTNVRLDSNCENPLIKEGKSNISIDFTMDIPIFETYCIEKTIKIIFKDVFLNMPEGVYKDEDGLISNVELKQEGSEIIFSIKLNYNSIYKIEYIKGIPSKLNVIIDRSPLSNILKGKTIILNPIYKSITKSPTSLMPHIPMKAIANKLKFLLNLSKAEAVLTWENIDDINKINSDLNSNILINISTDVSEKNESGFKIYYSNKNLESKRLGEIILKDLEIKSPLDNLGMYPKEMPSQNNNIIPVTVIPGIENNRLDDAHLRDVDYRNKVAQAIFNGILKYYSQDNRI
ncbi:MAG: N-acetylmuramoyl-L-alanine amidase [Thermoanaerobacteraceae bacterium]|nr:N-acetylmuramoyl-L-alanine amidase [Thermoanaerobacteraceae bacterium]